MKQLWDSSERKRDVSLILGLLFFTGLTRSVTFYLIPDGQYNDDASFLLRALNFARVKEALILGNPIHFAPGWPLLLAPFLKLSNEWYSVGRVVTTVLTSLTAVMLAVGFAKRVNSRLFGAAVALLFLNAPQVLILGSSLMAEPFYIFLAVVCLWAGREIRSHQAALGLGLAGGWCFLTKTEGLVVAAAVGFVTLIRADSRRFLGTYLGGFALVGVLLRLSLPQVKENAHLKVAKGVFGGSEFPNKIAYLQTMVGQNANLALESLLNSSAVWAHCLWLIPVVALAFHFRKFELKSGLLTLLQEPVIIWLLLYPAIFLFWPFFNARYWPIWTVLLFVSAIAVFPTRARWTVMGLLLLLQAPGAWTWYQTGPLAARFEHEIYLPYYRSLSSGQRVLTLNSSRVSTIARVPAFPPMMASDFQSLPIGMAYMGCDLIEWEVRKRTLTSVTGQDARLYPPEALAGLRKSSLFKLEKSCPFSECYRLIADPEKLKQAGTLYSHALQTSDLKKQRELLVQCLQLVPDLPEAQLVLCRNELQADPKDDGAQRRLQALLEKYPFLGPAKSGEIR